MTGLSRHALAADDHAEVNKGEKWRLNASKSIFYSSFSDLSSVGFWGVLVWFGFFVSSIS